MSRALLLEHRALWERKPVLARIYAPWFELLLAAAPEAGRVLEVGAGPGFLAAYARKRRPDLRFTAMDVLEAGWNDLVGDGLRLPFGDGVMDAVLGLDLVHHLARPASFFREAARTLRATGRVAVVEPWVTPLSYPVYRFFHQEGCTIGLDPWDPFGVGEAGGKDAFDGDAAVVWRLVRDAPAARWAELGFAPPQVTVLNGLAYLLSLGFKARSLLPLPLVPALLKLDGLLQPAASLLGLRALVVWERERG